MAVNRLPTYSYDPGLNTLYFALKSTAGWWVTGSTFSTSKASAKLIDLTDPDAIGDYLPAPSDLTGLPAGNYVIYVFLRAGASKNMTADAPYLAKDDDWRWDGDSGETMIEIVEEGTTAALLAAGLTGGGTVGDSGEMTLTMGRALVRYFARQAGDPTAYDNTAVDMSIQGIFDDFILVTNCTRATTAVSLIAGTYAYNAALVVGFHSDRVLRVWIEGQRDLQRPNHGTLLDERRCRPDAQCCPRQVAFTSSTAFELFATPDKAYTLNFDWYQPLTAFTPGTATPDDVILNVRSDYARTVLMYGAPALLQATDPQHKYANVSYQKYEAFRDSVKGKAGNRGAKSIERKPPPIRW